MVDVKQNAPLWIVIALSAKAALFGINMSDASVAVSLIGLLSFREYTEKHKKMKEIEENTNKRLEEMTAAINAQNTVIKAQAEEYDRLRGSITGLKLQYGQKDTNIIGGRKLG